MVKTKLDYILSPEYWRYLSLPEVLHLLEQGRVSFHPDMIKTFVPGTPYYIPSPRGVNRVAEELVKATIKGKLKRQEHA